MRFFHCRGCEAKDSEITHLMAQLDKLQAMVETAHARLAELAEPGIALRLASAARHMPRPAPAPPAPVLNRAEPPPLTEKQQRRLRMVPGFPGYGPEPSMKPNVELDEEGEGA